MSNPRPLPLPAGKLVLLGVTLAASLALAPSIRAESPAPCPTQVILRKADGPIERGQLTRVELESVACPCRDPRNECQMALGQTLMTWLYVPPSLQERWRRALVPGASFGVLMGWRDVAGESTRVWQVFEDEHRPTVVGPEPTPVPTPDLPDPVEDQPAPPNSSCASCAGSGLESGLAALLLLALRRRSRP